MMVADSENQSPAGPARLARLLVVDDSAATLKGLCDFVQDQKEFELAGTARGGREALELVARLQPDVVLLDMGMPELNGLECARAIRERFPRVVVIHLSGHDSPVWREASDEAGAHGFVSKARVYQDLHNEICRHLLEHSLTQPPQFRG